MAIRFDKDSRRATNGPMIFFSDPSAEISLGEEIRGAIESHLSFYAYRRPGDMMISFGSSESVVEGIDSPGFVVAPFLPHLPYLTIPYKPQKGVTKIDFKYSFPEKSTTQEEYETELRAIQNELDKDNLHGKVVAARVIVDDRKIDPAATFSNLCRLYPDAFVFCFSTPLTGFWIGASPELLLESQSNLLSTMALAGTRRKGCNEEWDFKNTEEQQMVTDFIVETFQNSSLQPNVGKKFRRGAGVVEHICTPITACLPSSGFTIWQLNNLLRNLSPTPALCGLPRNKALNIIKEYEHFDRGCYGGFCGPFHSPSDFTFFVNLRSALIEEKKFCIFVGGGITHLSDPTQEWEETALKSQTILQAIIT